MPSAATASSTHAPCGTQANWSGIVGGDQRWCQRWQKDVALPAIFAGGSVGRPSLGPLVKTPLENEESPVANTRSAAKMMRVAERRRLRNQSVKSAVKTFVRKAQLGVT